MINVKELAVRYLLNNQQSDIASELCIFYLTTDSFKQLLSMKKDWEKVTYLELQGKDLVLPPEINCFTELKTLDLSCLDLSAVPEELGELKNLEELDLSYNKLKNLPDSICNLTKLTKLSVASNKKLELPKNISKLKKLVSLTISYIELKTLPEGIFELTQLKFLVMIHCKITKLPSSIKKLVNLETLNLISNQLMNLPVEIGELHALKELFVCCNFLEKIPECIFKLKKLVKFDFSANELKKFPVEFIRPILELGYKENLFPDIKAPEEIMEYESVRALVVKLLMPILPEKNDLETEHKECLERMGTDEIEATVNKFFPGVLEELLGLSARSFNNNILMIVSGYLIDSRKTKSSSVEYLLSTDYVNKVAKSQNQQAHANGVTTLMEYAKDGNLFAVRACVSAGACILQKDAQNMTAIDYASINKNAVVKQKLSDIVVKQNSDGTITAQAAKKSSFKFILFLAKILSLVSACLIYFYMYVPINSKLDQFGHMFSNFWLATMIVIQAVCCLFYFSFGSTLSAMPLFFAAVTLLPALVLVNVNLRFYTSLFNVSAIPMLVLSSLLCVAEIVHSYRAAKQFEPQSDDAKQNNKDIEEQNNFKPKVMCCF